MNIKSTGCLAVGAILFVGCSSVQPPRAAISTADFAVQSAQKSSAPENSPLELKIAREKLEKAKDAMGAEQYVKARRLAEEALVDAQLAESKARSEEAAQTARQLRASIESLRKEAAHSGG